MRTESAKAVSLGRVFGEASLQVNWQTVCLEHTSETTGGASYPVLYPPATIGDSQYRFEIDAVVLGVGFSITWITAAADEQACVAIAPKSTRLRIVGSKVALYQSSIFCYAAVTASQLIQRNPGFMFPMPLVKFVPAGTVLQMFGSRQTSISWRNLATLYYVTVPDYLKLMEASALL